MNADYPRLKDAPIGFRDLFIPILRRATHNEDERIVCRAAVVLQTVEPGNRACGSMTDWELLEAMKIHIMCRSQEIAKRTIGPIFKPMYLEEDARDAY
jgi:hypothetical protein